MDESVTVEEPPAFLDPLTSCHVKLEYRQAGFAQHILIDAEKFVFTAFYVALDQIYPRPLRDERTEIHIRDGCAAPVHTTHTPGIGFQDVARTASFAHQSVHGPHLDACRQSGFPQVGFETPAIPGRSFHGDNMDAAWKCRLLRPVRQTEREEAAIGTQIQHPQRAGSLICAERALNGLVIFPVQEYVAEHHPGGSRSNRGGHLAFEGPP